MPLTEGIKPDGAERTLSDTTEEPDKAGDVAADSAGDPRRKLTNEYLGIQDMSREKNLREFVTAIENGEVINQIMGDASRELEQAQGLLEHTLDREDNTHHDFHMEYDLKERAREAAEYLGQVLSDFEKFKSQCSREK